MKINFRNASPKNPKIHREKPTNRKEIITFSKPEDKIEEILLFIKNQIKNDNQINSISIYKS